MSFTLKPYQEQAVNEVLDELRDAQDVFTRRSKKTAVGLSAPTGAGKTVIATAVVERLLLGDAGNEPNRELSVLWLTDDPALNRQTINKMLAASANLTEDDLIEIDGSFDKPRLEKGKVHFAHIHLFGRGTTSMQKGNDRENGLWEIIANTVERYGANFLLVRDEAHRGTEGGNRDATIIDRITHGGPREHFSGIAQPPSPVVLGISATLDNFRNEMTRPSRSLEEVTVDVTAVRESGLLKDRVIVRYPGENQPAEATLLETAVDALKKADTAWQAYADATGTATVEPLLVVQVKPGATDDELATYLQVLESRWSLLKGDAVAHAFDTHATLHVRDRELRYVAPDRIVDETRLRVVFFKNALTTGWDCPRAEVMLSFRTARDFTNIAQLIGRMIRTPRGERVDGDDSLNAVTLYLPHYDKVSVAKVITALGDDTGGDINIELEPVDCVKRTGLPAELWEAFGALPTDVRDKKQWKSEVDRLLGLARLLRQHDIVHQARAQVEARIVGAIGVEANVRETELKALREDVVMLDLAGTVWDHRQGETYDEGNPDQVHAGARDIESQYSTALRLLPDASGKWYWNHLCDVMDAEDAKVHVAALTKTTEMAVAFKRTVEQAASGQIETWRNQFQNDIATKPRSVRNAFDAVWSSNVGTHIEDLVVPATYSAATERVVRDANGNATAEPIDTWDDHIYVSPGHRLVAEGKFPAVLTGWEKDVLAKEQGRGTHIGWYRNPSRSQHGVGVAYKDGNTTGVTYPDFLIFHNDDGDIAIDIVDPHQHNQADTGPKWAGLARWAARNDDKVRRVVAVIKDGEQLKALDLTREGIAELLDNCHSKSDIETLFADLGSNY